MDDRGRLAQPLKRDQNPRPRKAAGTAKPSVRPPSRRSRAASRDAQGARNLTWRGRLMERLRPIFEIRLPRYAGVAAALMLVLSSAGYGIASGGHGQAIVAQLKDARDAVANAVGFRIAAVALGGQKQVTREEILAMAGVTGRTSLLFLDAENARASLKANPWIAEATVLKLYPDRLHISVTERQAYALWQKDGRVSVIAADGTVVEPYVAPRFAALPLVVGRGAEKRASEFLTFINRYPAVRDQLRAAILVAERRWNLRLKNGIDVRLPEIGMEKAVETLIALDNEKKLISRDITAIDLRLADRVTVRLSDTAAKEREDLLKDKKDKRKGGAA
jgi:cell division protein FtsQ